jgi:small-conductance mechanosensitive channel
MKQRNNLQAAGLILLLLACAAGYFWTRDNALSGPAAKPAATPLPVLSDAHLVRTARQLAAMADTADEQDQAREALRLANHALDVAFTTALGEAQTATTNSAVTPGSQELAARIASLKDKVADGQDRVAQLTKQATSNPAAAGQLEYAKATLELDQDDLADAQEDLARAGGGDQRTRLARALALHQAAQQNAAPLAKPAALPPLGTLKAQAQQWFLLRGKQAALLSAREQAQARAAQLISEHNALESQAGAVAPPAAGQSNEETSAAAVARLRQLALQKKTLSELDKRIEDCQQLANSYLSWSELVETRQRAALHLLLRSLVAIIGVLLVLVLARRLTIHYFRNEDRRKRHLVEAASAIACQFLGLIVILMIVFGPPNQISTVLGLATAGLTLALKDFIVSFIGWFVLMGRNGVRIGDWVEINGVSGEVIEIGALKTVLLEMGNWTGKGHPTGRRVSFSNGYAIDGHYFNFSTTGQWLWDELQITLPTADDPYRVAEEIRQRVERETAEASAEAARDWERVTHQYGVTKFSATPSVDLRPGANGLDVAVRYITRAPERYDVKTRLFRAIVELLHGAAPATPVA